MSALRTAITGLALALAAGVALGQTEVWVHHYSGTGNQNDATAIAMSPDSTVVVTGFSVGSDFSRDIYTIKVRRGDGGEVWARRWTGATGARDEAWAVAVDDSGNAFVAGKTYTPATDTDYVVIKYKGNDGTELWAKTYHNLGVDAGWAVVADQRGGCFVTGHSNAAAGNTNQDYLTIHYDAAGSRRWVSRFNGTGGHDYPMAMMLGDSGYLYLTGYSWGGAVPQYDYLTVKLDTLDGDTIWTRRYDGTAIAPKADYAYAITQDDSQYVYVTGRAGEQGTWYDATTIKYTPAGAVVWTNRFDAGWLGTDGGGNVKVDENYNVYVGGIVLDAIDDMYDFLTFRINKDNTIAWFRTFDSRVEDDDSLTAMVVDDRGNVYVTGWTYVYQGDIDWMTIKYNPDGAKIWSASHMTFGEDDWPFGMVMDEFGEIYITGFDYAGPDENYCTVKYTEDDVGAFRIVLPEDSFRVGATVIPRAWVRNYSALVSNSFTARCEIGGFYFDAQMVDTIPAYDSVLVTFSPWLVEIAALGTHQIRCYTMLDVDKEVTNDSTFGLVTGVPVWERLPDVPLGAKSKGVQAGGALGFVPDSLVYAFKGNNTVEFYVYNTRLDAWFERETIPAAVSGRKRVKAGAQLDADTSGNLYAFKGNNTVEFWKYSIAGRTWTQKDDYPLGASSRKLKGGSSLAYVAQQNALYSCKGNNTTEFNCFDIANDTWLPKSPAPTGPSGRKKFKDGSAMAYDGVGTIYLLKGATYEFYGYSIAHDSWYQKKDIRNSMYSSKRRKMKKGAGAAFDTQFNLLYVMKGGKSGEFWFFDPARDTWVERPTDSFPTPSGTKLPYTGADLCYGGGKIFALRGNKTIDFWRYNANFPLGYDTFGFGPQAKAVSLPKLRLAVAPNPFVGRTQLRYSLPAAGRVRLELYDATGRLARVVQDDWQGMGEHVAVLESDGLAAGVYVARLRIQTEAGSSVASRKLLVSR
jgi:hypothetical protein